MLLWIMLAVGCKDRGETGDPLDTGEPASELAWEAAAEDVAEGAFLSVWGASGEDVWIVGGQPDTGHILRGSGAAWAAQALPEGTPLLNWVHGTSSSDVWVAGLGGTLLHWDGGAWEDHSVETEAAFWGLYADPDGSVLAVGGASRWGGEAAMIWRYSGGEWSSVALPEKLEKLGNIFKVHRDDDGRYWLVGAGGAAMVGDGADFSAVATGTASDLVTVSRPPGGGPLVVVGGRGTGIVMEPDGAGLSASTTANAGLNGVCVYPSGLSVVVGERGYSALFDAETDALTELPAITLDILHATWGEPGGRMYAVGGNLNTAEETFHGVILTAAAPE